MRAPERVDDALRSQLQVFLKNSRHLAPAGNSAAAIVFVLVIGNQIHTSTKIWWFASVLAVAVALAALHLRMNLMLRPSVARVSWTALVAHAASGLVWGALPWLDSSGPDASYQWIALCFMFAISAGTLSGITGMTGLTAAVLIPMWTAGATRFLITGQPALAVACLVFLALVLNDSRSTGKLLLELIRLRITSANAARLAEWEANHDPLTSLPNRLGLQDLAEQRAPECSGRVTAMFVDLDHFKEVNDRFGHPAGDALLILVGERLRAEVDVHDVVGRLGGDEFLVLMFREVDDHAATALAQRLIRVLEEPFRIDGEEAYISASIGITRCLDRSATRRIDVAKLVQESDKALYEAKRNGRRQAVLFDADLRAQLSERSGLEMALRRAVRSDAIEAWGQPVYDLRTGEVVWVELLARWEATPGSFVPPSLFVPLAEEIGVIDDLGRQMLRHATDALARWSDHPALGTASVAVNVSALHIMRDNLVEDISSLVACRGLAAHRLIVELTESYRLTDVDRVAATFEQLSSLGVRLAVDDFGTGYSSLGQLLALPVSIVKIDRSLTSGCEHDEQRGGVVRAIRQLAASLGHVVVAEGVETPSERAAVTAIGIDQAQGYLFCPPLPLPALEQELAAHGSRLDSTLLRTPTT
jgi:diguanylate cyclase (GGDEF)-like protein